VRLAKSSPAMWAPILTENKDNILAALDGYIANLTDIRAKVAESDGASIYSDLSDINKIRDILDLEK